MNKIKKMFSTNNFRHGSYSVGLSVVVIAIVIVVNMLLSQLPVSIKNIDMSSTKIYTTGDVTQEMVDSLTNDVKIHIIAQETGVDTRITNFIEHYASLSSHLSYDFIDPVLHPAVLETYGVSENSVVVECPDTEKTASFSFGDIILYDEMSYYYYGQAIETEFDGEGQLTSAINEVTNDVSKKIYLLEGHGESALGSSITEMFDKQNFETMGVNLLTAGQIPEDCDLLLINGAVSDIAEDEKEMLEAYMSEGGHMMILLGMTTEPLTNIESLMATYGITMAEGYIADAERYYQNSMFYIFPQFAASGEITGGFGSNDLALVINSRGFTVDEPEKDTITTQNFMTTSSNGYAVVDEENQTQGTFVLGTVAEDTIDEETTSRLTVIGTTSLLDDQVVQAFPSLVNLDVFMNAATAGFDDIRNISIAAKSLEVTYNTVTNGRIFGMIFILVIPVIILAAGFMNWLSRRKA